MPNSKYFQLNFYDGLFTKPVPDFLTPPVFVQALYKLSYILKKIYSNKTYWNAIFLLAVWSCAVVLNRNESSVKQSTDLLM